jgi:hypothetical protein
MLTTAMGRLLAMDMDMFQLPMADMLLSATDMSLLSPSNGYEYASTSDGGHVSLSHEYDLPQYGYGYASTRTFYGGYASPDSWICFSQLEQQHHELDMNTNTRTGKAHSSLDLN